MSKFIFIPITIILVVVVWSIVALCIDPRNSHLYFAPLALCSAGFIAFIVYLRDKEKITNEEDYRHSVFYFKQSFDALDAAYDKIIEGNKRINWLTAARYIKNAESLRNNIKSEEISAAYDIKLHRVRSKFYDYLMSLEIQVPFYLESKDWLAESTEDAIKRYRETRVGVSSRSKYYINYYKNMASRLHPGSVEVVLNFSTFENEQLKDKKFSEYEFTCNSDLARSARKYFEVIEEIDEKICEENS